MSELFSSGPEPGQSGEESVVTPVTYKVAGTLRVPGLNLTADDEGGFVEIGNWHEDLSDNTSVIFQRTAKLFESMLDEISTSALMSGQAKVVEFRQGSIIAGYEIDLMTLDTTLDSPENFNTAYESTAQSMIQGGELQGFSENFDLNSIETSNMTYALGESDLDPENTIFTVTQSAVSGAFRVADNITLADNSTVSSKVWPEDLNNPDSPLYSQMSDIFTPIVSSSRKSFNFYTFFSTSTK